MKTRPFIYEKVHAGSKKFSVPIFCFEGYFGAMSAELTGFKAVALGGCGEGYFLTEAVDKLKSKPQIIILFDIDKAGQEAASDLRQKLLAIKCPCVVRFLSKTARKINKRDLGCASDSAVVLKNSYKIDANDIFQNQGTDVL